MRVRLILLLGLWLAAIASPAAASGWLEAVRQRLMPPSPPGSTTLGEVLVRIQGLPAADVLTLAAEAGEEGHWRLLNRAGEPCSAASPDELTRCLAALLPGTAPASAGPLSFHLTEASVFRHRTALRDLPARSQLHMVSQGASFRLVAVGKGETQRHFAEVGPRLMVELTGEAEFAETRRQLARPIATARIRLVGLEPGSKNVLGARQSAAAPPTIAVQAVDPDYLRHAFFALRGDLVLMVGRFAGERLVYQPASGPERSILIRDYADAAAAQDADLLLLGSATARQPGTRNWLWLKTGVAGLDASLAAPTLGEALVGLIGEGDPLAVTVPAALQGDRLRIVAQRLQRVDAASPFNALSEVVADLLSAVTTSTQATRLELHVSTTARRHELAARIVPGIPAPLQFGYLAALVLALPGLVQLRRWWALVWPPEVRGEYGSAPGHWAAQGVRETLFLVLFAPLIGIWASLWSLTSLLRRRRPSAAGGIGAPDRAAP